MSGATLSGVSLSSSILAESLLGNVPDAVGPFEPFVDQALFRSPVVIESVTLFKKEKNWFVRVRSTQGAEGWSVGHPKWMPYFHRLFTDRVAPFFQGKDARQLDRLMDGVYLSNRNYKTQGIGFWIPVAAAEFAILDLLGREVNRPVADVLGGPVYDSVPLYVANNHREYSAEESLGRIQSSVESENFAALKIKIGGRMKVYDQVAGRTKQLIPLVAEALGDRCTMYADANGSYPTVAKAIEIGRLCESNGFSFYEEPCPLDYLDTTREVADALEIPIAWGEHESSQYRFWWMMEKGGIGVAQPDLLYFGGLIRCLRVARMAAMRGLDCTAHISGGGLAFLYVAIFASLVKNRGAYQEYKGINRNFPWESPGVDFVVKDGQMPVPKGPGLGINIDPDFLANAQLVES